MKTVNATFSNPAGQPSVGATVTFLLSQPESCSIGLLVHESVTAITDENGAVSVELWCNDEFETAGSFYNVTLHDLVFGRILFEQVIIAGTSPINLATLTPLSIQ